MYTLSTSAVMLAHFEIIIIHLLFPLIFAQQGFALQKTPPAS